MLNSHPQISIPLESLFIIDYLRAPKNVSINELKKLIINEPEIKEWGLNLKEVDIEDCKSRKALIERVNTIYADKHGGKIWGQKTPRFIRHGKLLKSNYPSAKFIHLIRDPRGVANSLKKSNVHFSNTYYAAKRWNIDISYGLSLKKKYGAEVLELKYKDLIKDPKSELKRICKFLEVRYSAKMLDYTESGNEEYNSYFSEIHKNLNIQPNPKLVGKWAKELPAHEIELVEYINKNLMNRLGYELTNSAPRKNSRLIFLMKLQRIAGLAKQIANYLSNRRKYFLYSIWRKYKLGFLKKDIKLINY
jgi:hypothetical protein